MVRNDYIDIHTPQKEIYPLHCMHFSYFGSLQQAGGQSND
jgi:hypothetical protein